MFYVLYYYHQTYTEKNYRQNKFIKMNYNFFIKFFGVLGRGRKKYRSKKVVLMSFNFWKNFNSEDDIHHSQPLFLKRRKLISYVHLASICNHQP